MFRSMINLVLILMMALVFIGCEEQTEPDQEQPAENTQIDSEQPSASSDMVEIRPDLPAPMFVGTPTNMNIDNLEAPRPEGVQRPPLLAPEGTTNVALGKTVTSSDPFPIIGELEMITNGVKSGSDGNFVELGPFHQYVTIDLGQQHDIYGLYVWHYHQQPRVYFDVIVQTADDPDFSTNVNVLFNNDTEGQTGLGVGTDKRYIETSEGKLIDAKGVQGRYVRLHSNGSNSNDLNHYIEVEVYGKPVE